MTAVSAICYQTASDFGSQSRAASPIAQRIGQLLWDAKSHARANASDWRSLTGAMIEELAMEHSEPNWDGYGALPIAPKAKELAQAFVDLLPFNFPAPDPVADPDGELALSWDFGPGHVFTISISDSGRVSYAGLLGDGGKRHGMEPFTGSVPAVVLATIRELHDRTRSL